MAHVFYFLTKSYKKKFRSDNESWVILMICEFLFQAHPEPEDAIRPPPAKRLRSEEVNRVIIVLPDGGRHQMDISRERTLKVGSPDAYTRPQNVSFLVYPE